MEGIIKLSVSRGGIIYQHQVSYLYGEGYKIYYLGNNKLCMQQRLQSYNMMTVTICRKITIINKVILFENFNLCGPVQWGFFLT